MKLVYEASFARDLKRVKDRQLLQRVGQVLEALKLAPDLGGLSGIKKMQGHDTYYRIRLGDYRIGIEVVHDEVILVRMLHRRDIYKYFP